MSEDEMIDALILEHTDELEFYNQLMESQIRWTS